MKQDYAVDISLILKVSILRGIGGVTAEDEGGRVLQYAVVVKLSYLLFRRVPGIGNTRYH